MGSPEDTFKEIERRIKERFDLVERLIWSVGLDHTDEAAVFFTVVLKDKIDKSLYDWSELVPVHDSLWSYFLETPRHEQLYITFSLASEINSPDEPEEDAEQVAYRGIQRTCCGWQMKSPS